MQTDPNFKISIPVPCHEDWNQMTPNEKGAFCGKCCKTVIDFSNKTPEQIRETLTAQSGKKICGRFQGHQIGESRTESVHLNIPSHLLPRNISHRKAFALALFFVFGTTLFSCRTAEDHVVGEIAIVNTIDTAQTEDQTQNVKLTGDTSHANIVMGQTSVKPECTVKGDVKVEHPLGEVSITKDTIRSSPPDTLKNEPKMGKVKLIENDK
ncbi:MAG: hypothetical protein ACJ77K_01620 [Bacteroidia bacterium]